MSAPAGGAPKERAFLVGLDYRTHSWKSGAKRAKGSLTSAAHDCVGSRSTASKAPSIPEFSAEESLDELREARASGFTERNGNQA